MLAYTPEMLIQLAVCGVIVLTVFAIAFASDDDVLIKLQTVAVAHWIIYNIVLAKIGFGNGAVLLVALSCVGAILSAWIGFRPRSWTAFAIAGLWIAAAINSTWFYASLNQAAPLHYLGLNATFIARMLVVGLAGLVVVVHRLGPVPHWARARRLGR